MTKKEKDIVFKEFCDIRNEINSIRSSIQVLKDKTQSSEVDRYCREEMKTLVWRLDYWVAREVEVHSMCSKLGLDFMEFERIYGETNG